MADPNPQRYGKHTAKHQVNCQPKPASAAPPTSRPSRCGSICNSSLGRKRCNTGPSISKDILRATSQWDAPNETPKDVETLKWSQKHHAKKYLVQYNNARTCVYICLATCRCRVAKILPSRSSNLEWFVPHWTQRFIGLGSGKSLPESSFVAFSPEPAPTQPLRASPSSDQTGGVFGSMLQ